MAKLATKCGLLLFLATDHPLLAKRALERKKKPLIYRFLSLEVATGFRTSHLLSSWGDSFGPEHVGG
jgi:hypothetical protein